LALTGHARDNARPFIDIQAFAMTDTNQDPRLSRMKRRLRKKQYLGEFQELAFEIKVSFKNALSEDDLDTFLGDFIDYVEERKLDYIGGFDNAWVEGTIMANKRYTSPTAEDRTALLDWLKARAEVGEANASELHDAWHHDGEV